MRQIPLRKRGGEIVAHALVDDEDYDWLNSYRWHRNTSGYAARRNWDKRNKCKMEAMMHRLICGTPKGMDTDHINGNRLDNRKKNLRICTRSQNQMNRGRQKNNTSGHTGVYWFSPAEMWTAVIKVRRAAKNLGYFHTIEEAIAARRSAAAESYGEFAHKESA